VDCSVLGKRSRAFNRTREATSDADLRAWCVRVLHHKVSDEYPLLAEPLPRNTNGKMLKADLRRVAELAAGANAVFAGQAAEVFYLF
jgi:long-chain acyl-CoA synthetase